MKRRLHTLFLLLLFLLAGAIINVAVAWGCAVFPIQTAHKPSAIYEEGGIAWTRFMPDDCAPYLRLMPVTSHVGLRCLVLKGNCQCDRALFAIYDFCAGWPCYAFAGQMWLLHGRPSPQLHNWHPIADIKFGWLPKNEWYAGIPTGLICSGFVINTIFYAALVWLLFAMPFAIRRSRRYFRRKRSLCPACAYPMGESPLCSECGRPVTRKSNAA